jgi:hypothetical protein
MIGLVDLPELGAPFEGGIFAGIGADFLCKKSQQIILLHDEFNGTWQKCKEWAEGLGGVLPSKRYAAILWANISLCFNKQWHWTAEEFSKDYHYAWMQNYAYGYQVQAQKENFLFARAIKLIDL